MLHHYSAWDNPPHPRAPLQIYVIDMHEVIIGGLIGRTHAIPEWLEISVIWVDEAMRGRSIGRQLMQLAETQAQRGEIVHMTKQLISKSSTS